LDSDIDVIYPYLFSIFILLKAFKHEFPVISYILIKVEFVIYHYLSKLKITINKEVNIVK